MDRQGEDVPDWADQKHTKPAFVTLNKEFSMLMHDVLTNGPVLVNVRPVTRATPRRRQLPAIILALPMFFGWAGVGELVYQWATGSTVAGTAPLPAVKKRTVASVG